jgi:putative DNA primase/helicase
VPENPLVAAPTLAPNHAKMIEDSAITPEVSAARGYFTARTKAELKRLGFADYQRLPPALVVPVYGVTGEIVTYQHRPDRPRIKKGKALKYETAADSQMRLDVPPSARQWIGDPARPLFITEGARKSDSAVSKDLCCIALLGVWNWRGENEEGGLTALADWESVALKSREAPRKVYLTFDSDIVEKKSVYGAMKRLKPFLELRGADVKIIYLPPGEGGAKVGLDDFFAAGRTVAELLQLATDKLREPIDDGPRDPAIPRGFLVAADGSIQALTDTDVEPLFICSPLKILAHTRSDDSDNWGKLLEWSDYDLVKHKWAMPMDELAGDGKDWLKRLMGEGLRVGSSRKAKERLSDFIQSSDPQARARCVTRPGWHAAAYVDLAGAINAPDGEAIILQTSADWPRGFDSKGSIEDWKAQVSQYCRRNPLLLFGVSVAFAAKLLGPLRLENAGFHLRGTSSKGKTTLIQVAASVDGDGAEKGGFIENWRATANGLEAVCERHNDSILPLDELAQCDPRVAAEAAYLIANGQGKGRMNRAITARRRANWRTITLSTGEISLSSHVLQAGKRTRAGQEVRLLDLPIGDRQHGVFDDLHGFASGQAFANHLKAAAGQYYGVGGREFVRKLTADDPNFGQFQKAFERFQSQFVAKLAITTASSEVSRAAAKFALVAFAGEIATGYGLTSWEDGDAEGAARELFSEWLSARGSSDGADDEAIVRQVRLFIEQHGESRFRRLDTDDPRTVTNRAGYFDGADAIYYFSREVFQTEVCKGFDPTQAARALERRKLLTTNHGFQFKRRDPDTGKMTPFYAVSGAILE